VREKRLQKERNSEKLSIDVQICEQSRGRSPSYVMTYDYAASRIYGLKTKPCTLSLLLSAVIAKMLPWQQMSTAGVGIGLPAAAAQKFSSGQQFYSTVADSVSGLSQQAGERAETVVGRQPPPRDDDVID